MEEVKIKKPLPEEEIFLININVREMKMEELQKERKSERKIYKSRIRGILIEMQKKKLYRLKRKWSGR